MTKSQELEPRANVADQAIDDWPVRTAVSLTLPETLTFDEWQEVGRKICKASTSLRWYIGDWLLHGERKWGEMFVAAVTITGLSYDTLAHCKSVAGKFEFWRRRQNLRCGDHREVSSLSTANQDVLLDAVAAGAWSREKLRHEVAAAHQQEKDAKIALQESLRTPEERAQIERERDERRAASEAELQAVMTSISRTAGRIQRTFDGSAPEIQLDNSTVSDAVPEELRSLKVDPATEVKPTELRNREVEPPPPIDRVAVAKAALDALSLKEATEVFSDWEEERTADANDNDGGVDKYSWPCIPKNLKEVKLNKEQDKIITMLLKHFKSRRSQRILIMMLEGEWEWMTPNAEHPERGSE
jgi:hypothetical protein